jgi:hypothetical protein
MDVQAPAEITARLRGAGVDVLTAQEDGCDELPDGELLDRAISLGRELFTQDQDFLAEGTRRQREGVSFCGIFYAQQDTSRNGLYAKWLEAYAKLESPGDVAGRVIFIP